MLYEKISQEMAKGILEKLNLINTKSIKGNGNFEVVATSEAVDRDGEILTFDGWEFDNFRKNPVVLLSHRYDSLPIGVVTEIVPDSVNKQYIMKGIFADTEDGQEARKLYDDGILRTVSVSFIPKKFDGNKIVQKEMLELSFVSVPSNPDALSMSRMLKFFSKFYTDEQKEVKEEVVEVEKVEEKDIQINSLSKLIKDLTAIYSHYSFLIPKKKELEGKTEVKSGRVLSAKNRDLVKTAINALSVLLDATEPEKANTQEEAKELVVDVQAMQKLLEGVIKKAKNVREKV